MSPLLASIIILFIVFEKMILPMVIGLIVWYVVIGLYKETDRYKKALEKHQAEQLAKEQKEEKEAMIRNADTRVRFIVSTLWNRKYSCCNKMDVAKVKTLYKMLKSFHMEYYNLDKTEDERLRLMNESLIKYVEDYILEHLIELKIITRCDIEKVERREIKII